jgi:hypothetical protein
MAQTPQPPRTRHGASTLDGAAENAPAQCSPSATDTISPQDFYAEMVTRPDVQSILKRLAQVEDQHTSTS